MDSRLIETTLDWNTDTQNELILSCSLITDKGQVLLARKNLTAQLQFRLCFNPPLRIPPQIRSLGTSLGDIQTKSGTFNLGILSSTEEWSRAAYEVGPESEADGRTYYPIEINLAAVRIAPDSQKIVLHFGILLPEAYRNQEFLVKVEPVLLQGNDIQYTWDAVSLTNQASTAVEMRVNQDEQKQQEYLNRLKRDVYARCVELWRGAGLSEDEAQKFANDRSIAAPLPNYYPNANRPLIVLKAPVGSGKSLISLRLMQHALDNRQNDSHAPIPIYLKIIEMSCQLRQTIENLLSDLGNLKPQGIFIIIDGLDEIDTSQAEKLLRDARMLTRIWSNIWIIITSRSTDLFNLVLDSQETIDIPELSEPDTLKLINQVSGHEYSIIAWEDPICEAIRRPLFAILFGLYLRQHDIVPDLSLGQLIGYFINEALRRNDLVDCEEVLRKLAVNSVEQSGGLISDIAIGQPDKLKKLVNSGLLIQRPHGVDFALLFIRDWFAAKSVAIGQPPISQIITNPQRLFRWKQPLTIAIGISSPQTLSSLLPVLMDTYPGFASQIIKEGTARDDYMGNSPCPPQWECETLIQIAMKAWLQAINPLDQLLAPTATSVFVEGSLLSVTFLHSDGSSVSYNRYPGTQPAWEWKLSLSELGRRLETEFQLRRFWIEGSILAHEWYWGLLTSLLRKPSFYAAPLSLIEIEEMLTEQKLLSNTNLKQLRWNDYGNQTYLLQQTEISRLKDWFYEMQWNKQVEFPAPWPINRNLFVAEKQGFAAEEITSYVSYIYTQSLNAYQQIVEQWFPKIKFHLWLYNMLPACFNAVISPSQSPFSVDLRIISYLEPLEYKQPNTANIRFNENWSLNALQKEGLAIVREKILALRRNSCEWLFPTIRYGALDFSIFDRTPITNLAYHWLKNDLEVLGWMDQFF